MLCFPQVHSRSYPSLRNDVDLLQLARNLPGLSGAELENVLNESALAAIRREGVDISTGDVYSAVDRILQVRETELQYSIDRSAKMGIRTLLIISQPC